MYLRVVHGNQSRSVTTSYRVWPGEWDGDRRRLVVLRGSSERKQYISDYEDCMSYDLSRMEGIIREVEKEGAYTVDEIMLRYRAIMSGNSVRVYAEKLAIDLECRGRERTARAYRTAATRFIRFNGGRDVKLEHITAGMISDFQQALKNEGCSMNTISFYMRVLRAIYNKAVDEKRVRRRMETPFAGVYTGVTSTRKLALTPQELAQLAEFDPTAAYAESHKTKNSGEEASALVLPESLQQALAMFLFCYHARGMCFVDMAYLKRSDIKRDVIRYRRRKTGQIIEIKILPTMRRTLDYFAPITAGSEYLFPIITNPDKAHRLQYESGLMLQNQRLKRIAALAGIDKRLSTRCARHSWATVAKGAGLPLAVISEGLGHSNQKTTQIYLNSLEQSILDRASQLVSEAIDVKRQRMRGGQRRYSYRHDRIFSGGCPMKPGLEVVMGGFSAAGKGLAGMYDKGHRGANPKDAQYL